MRLLRSMSRRAPIGLTALAAAYATGAAASCPIDRTSAPDRPLIARATVVGFADPLEVERITRSVESRTRAPENPAYLRLPRIWASYVVNGARSSTIAAIVDGAVPERGALVTLAFRHRDPGLPCAFIPVIVLPAAPVS